MPSPISLVVQGGPAGHLRLEKDSVREAWGLQAIPSQKEAEGHGQGLMVLSGDWSAQSWACVNTDAVPGHLDCLGDASQEHKFPVKKMPLQYFLYCRKIGLSG